MSPRLRGWASAFLILLSSTVSLAAPDVNPRLILSLGGSILPDRPVRDSSGAAHNSVFDGKLLGGVQATVNLHAPLALEAGFRIGRGEFRDRSSTAAPGVNFSTLQLFGNVFYSTPYSDGGLRLFASGGAGMRRIRVGSSSGADWGGSVNFGGGLEARASRRLSIRAEARDFIGAMPRLIPVQSQNGWMHDIQTSLGLIIHLK